MADVKISRHELKILHRRLKERANQIRAEYEDTRGMLQEFHDSYIQLYEYFPVRRYPKLKRLIKISTSKENMDEFRRRAQESSNVEQEDGERIAEDESPETRESRPLVSGGKAYGVAKQALRKLSKFCGFDNEPIEDEDVMNDEVLWQHISRYRRQIDFNHTEMTNTLRAMETLHDKYVRSKTSFFPVRFITLKRIVREMIAETKPDSKYEK